MKILSAMVAVFFASMAIASENDIPEEDLLLVEEDRILVEEVWTNVCEPLSHGIPEYTADRVSAPWDRIIPKIQGEFSRISVHPRRKWLISAFVRKFGQHGPRADFSWMLAIGKYGINSTSNDGSGLCSRTASIDSAMAREIQLEVAEAQVRYILTQPALAGRYIHMLYWGKWLRGGEHDHSWRAMRLRAIKSMPTGEYWWRARDFLVLSSITQVSVRVYGDEDIDPDKDLYEEAIHWSNDFAVGWPVEYEAEFPFPDWDDVAPISGQDIRDFGFFNLP